MLKYQLLILFYLSYSCLTFADLGRPAMSKRMLQAQLKILNAPVCHSEVQQKPNLLMTKVNTDYFMAKVSCSHQCTNSNIKVISEVAEQRFTPLELSLYEGDGSSTEKILWRSLGVTLVTWSKEICLNQAKRECHGLTKIKSFSVNNIHSGNWSFDGQLNCTRKDTVYSPFEDQFKLNNIGKTNYKPFNELFSTFSSGINFSTKNTMQEFIHINNSKDDLIKLFDDIKCKKKIKVHTCFGDCVWETDSQNQVWKETLSTNEPLGTDDFTICADTFIGKLELSKLSTSVKQFKCEKFVWEIMRKTEVMGSSCAALRTEIDCSELL